jgi:mannose-6-phosphate isomerase-like protein (cupin superfamily)
MSETPGFILKRGALEEGEPHPWGRLGFFTDQATTGVAGVTVGRARIDPGAANPLHVHDNCSEIILLLSGALEHVVGDQVLELSAGDLLIVSPGLPHRALSTGPGPADLIVIYNSGRRGFALVDPG